MQDNNNFQHQRSAPASIHEPAAVLPESSAPTIQPDQMATINNAPILMTWKTSIGLSILGVILGNLPGSMMEQLVPGTSISYLTYLALKIKYGSLVDYYLGTSSDYSSGALFLFLLFIAHIVAGLIYALKVYPSFFGEKPLLRSNKTVSFLNCLFGGIIFGLLWNHNLTRRQVGISNVVLSILAIIGVLILTVQLFATT